MRLCFNTVEIKKDEVTQLEEELTESDTHGAGKKKLTALLAKLRSATFISDALTTAHLHLLNEVFEKHYHVDSMASYQIGSRSHGLGAFSAYHQDAAVAVRQVFSEIEGNSQVIETLSPDVMLAMRNAEPKVRLVLMGKWYNNYDFSDFPLFT